MASTFLQLTNKVLLYLNETPLTSSNFGTARNLHATAKQATYDTVNEINHMKVVWPFNVQAGSQLTTVGDGEYAWPAGFSYPDWHSFYVEKDDTLNVSTRPLEPINKDEWFRFARAQDYDAGAEGRDTPKHVFSIPNGFGVTPFPNQAVTIKFTYYAIPTVLTDFDDESTIPSEFDYVITSGALSKMNLFKENPQGQQIAEDKYKNQLRMMQEILIPTEPESFVNTMVNQGKRNRTYGYLWPTA